MIHTHYCQLALVQAQKGRGFCSPNPAVGAILVRDNQIIGRGYHRGAGFPHAEVDALAGIEDASGATLYVTLEPCAHTGRTPPCTDLIIQKKVSHVIFSAQDAHYPANQSGQAVLQKAGIACSRVRLPQVDAFYESYRYFTRTHRPFVTAKIAMSMDGKIAGVNSEPIQITGEALSVLTHQSRLQSDAILTTVKTIIQDNPRFNVRMEDREIKKPLYVIDRQLSMPLYASIFKTTLSLTVFYDADLSSDKQSALMARGVRCIPIPCINQKLDNEAVIKALGEAGHHDVWVEAGGTYFASLVKSGHLLRAYVYIAPKCLGVDALSAFDDQANVFAKGRITDCRQVGEELLSVMEW